VVHDLYHMPLTLLNGTVWSFTPDGIAVEEPGVQQELLRLTIKILVQEEFLLIGLRHTAYTGSFWNVFFLIILKLCRLNESFCF
jgi:hypothetical protein